MPPPSRVFHYHREGTWIVEGEKFRFLLLMTADHAPGMQVQDHRQIEPALAGPDIADVARPFLIGPVGGEVALQQVWGDVEGVIAVRRRFELACPFNDNPVLSHQPPNTPVPHINPDFLQFFGHARAAIAAQAQARLLLDVGQNHHVRALPAAGGAAAIGPQATWTDIHHAA